MSVGDVAPQVDTIKLQCGRVLHFQDLSVLEFRDGEKLLGRPVERWFGDGESNVVTFGVLLWLLSRKHGLSRADILAGKWAFTLEDLFLDVVQPDIARHSGAVQRFFGGSQEGASNGSLPGASQPVSPTTSSAPSHTA